MGANTVRTRQPRKAGSNGRVVEQVEASAEAVAFYAIEKEIRGRSAEERRRVRQQKSRPSRQALPARERVATLADAFEDASITERCRCT